MSAGYAYNQYSIDTQYAYDFNFDGRSGLTVGIPVEYGILDWLAVRADFVYLQKGYSMQRAYNQGYRDRRDHYLSLPVMARFSFGGEKLRGFLHAGGYMGYWADSRVKGTEISWDNLIDDFLADNESFVFAPYDRRYEFISKRDYRIHPHIELEAEGRCYYALTSTTKDYMKHTKQPQYNTTFTIQAGVKYCF